MIELEEDKLRDLPGWESDAPVPICMKGDYRALTFCCKPGYSLTFGYKCKRDKALAELNLSQRDFVKIKENFSQKYGWDSDVVCFGSLSYCCMRRDGCPRRDSALENKYPEMTPEERLKFYFQKKKELSQLILETVLKNASNLEPDVKKRIKQLLELF